MVQNNVFVYGFKKTYGPGAYLSKWSRYAPGVQYKSSFAGASSLVLSLLDSRKAKRSLMMSFTAVQKLYLHFQIS